MSAEASFIMCVCAAGVCANFCGTVPSSAITVCLSDTQCSADHFRAVLQADMEHLDG